jgi:hypothetical protein
MKKLIFILTFLSVTLGVKAQVFDPMESGVAEPVLLSATSQSNYAVIVKSSNGYMLPYFWNGLDWSLGVEASGLKKIGLSADGELILVSAILFNNVLYVAAKFKSTADVIYRPVVFYLNNNVWAEVADNNKVLFECDDIYKLLSYNGNLVALIKSETKGTPVTIVYLNGSEWDKKGNSITKDQAVDKVSDAVVIDSKIFATGVFTNILDSTKRYLAEWDDTQWIFPASQPFGRSIDQVFGNYNGNLLLYGDKGNDAIKVFDKSQWLSLSNGLSDIEIVNLNSFAVESNGTLWACGSFRNIADSKISSLMYYDQNLIWRLADQEINIVSGTLSKFGNQAIIFGSFDKLYGEQLNNVAYLKGGYASVMGYVFKDMNHNCVKDSGDKPASWTNLVLNPGGHNFITDENGLYKIPVLKGNYSITIIPNKHWEVVCPTPSGISVTDLKTYTGLNSAIQAIPGKKDIAVYAADYDGWKASQTQPNSYKFCAINVGTEFISSGKLIVQVPTELLGMTFNPIPSRFINGIAEWDIFDLQVDQSYCITSTGYISESVKLGQKLTQTAMVEISGVIDPDQLDNQEDLEQTVVENFEPNSKSSDHGAVNKNSYAFHYRINFQNTGSGIVDKIRVIDTLDKDIWVSITKPSIEAASNNAGVKNYAMTSILNPDPKANGNYIRIHKWTFTNIDLPDSATDYEASKGWVDLKFYCDLRLMKKVEEVCNKAYIYFDNSEATITNKVCNYIKTIGIKSIESGSLKIYPNPANDLIHIDTKNVGRFEIINILGIKVGEGDLTKGTNYISAKNLSDGIYFLSLGSGETVRLVVTH